MALRIDQVEVVNLAVARLVTQRGRLRLDGDAALALDVHGIEHLRLHLPIGQPATQVNDAIRQRGLAVIDVRDDGKIADVLQDVMPCRNRCFCEARILADFGRQSRGLLLVFQTNRHPGCAVFALDQQGHIAPLGHLFEEII